MTLPTTLIDSDRHADLELPDGRKAKSLRWTPLRIELARLKIPNIRPEMGKEQLLDKYSERVSAVANELSPQRPITPAMMRAAVAFIDKQASA